MSSSHKMKTLTINGVQFTLVDETVGSLSDLNTTDKSSVVAAVNEVASNTGNGSGGNSVTIDATLTQEGHAADAKAVGDAINKLSSNSSPNVELDTTLTVEGKAADAKAVGDALAELKDKFSQGSNAELFDKADLVDPAGRNSFITQDGVEYYRYNATAQSFEWVNPSPAVGAVTITARGVSQYGGTGGTRLLTVYDDGTYGPELHIVVGGESQTVTVTTDENKTLSKITGNYDMENWVLLDMSVMSVKAEYLVREEYVLPVATADALGGVKADPAEDTDSQPVRIGEDGKLYTTPSSGDSPEEVWELIADVTMEEESQSYEQIFDDKPMKKLLVILDTLADDADATHSPFTASLNNEAGSSYKPNQVMYPLAVPRTRALQSVYKLSTFYVGDLPVLEVQATVVTSSNGTDNTNYFWHWENLKEKYYQKMMIPEICRFRQNTYGVFASGTRYRIYGVRA